MPPAAATMALGFVTGVLVSMTSVGSGSLLLCVLVLGYPLAARTERGHGPWSTRWRCRRPRRSAMPPRAGSTSGWPARCWWAASPASWPGARLATAVPERPLRAGLAVVLFVLGVQLAIFGRIADGAGAVRRRGIVSNVAVLNPCADRTAPPDLCADALEGAPPEEVLRWAIDRYADRLTFATGFGAEGCVLIDLIGRHRLPIDVFTLDTGVLFPETRALWRRLEARYGLTIRGVRPEPAAGGESDASLDPADRQWERDPDGCCARRKVFPLAAELQPGGRLDHRRFRRDQTPQRANAPVVGWDAKFGIAKVNPLVTWTSRDVWRHLHGARRAVQPAARPRLSQHRLPALHQPGGRG